MPKRVKLRELSEDEVSEIRRLAHARKESVEIVRCARLIEYLLGQMIATFPTERWLVIEDNLSIHKSRDVKTALLARPEIQILSLPKYACWLNLIEPGWKQLRSLARKGRRVENTAEMAASLMAALAYWNQHRHPYTWQKRPQCQPEILLGGYSSLPKLPGSTT